MSDYKLKQGDDSFCDVRNHSLMIDILADFSHDGIIDEHRLPEHSEDRFAIVLPVPGMLPRVLHKGEEKWQLTGGVRPIEVGALKVHLNEPLSQGLELVLDVDEDSRGRIHLFQRRETQWQHLGSEGVWHLGCIRNQEIMLGLVADSFAHTAEEKSRKWSGDFTFTATVMGEGVKATMASARFKVAPFLLASALDPVDEVLVIKNAQTQGFVEALRRIVPQTGASLRAIEVEGGTESDVWIQDAVEIGRVCVPTPQGIRQAIAVLAGIRAKHSGINCEPLDQYLREYFTNLDEIVVEAASPRAGTEWIDWYGNLEVSPPVTTLDGKEFPFGRILIGAQDNLGMHPDILAFLEAQSLQVPPLIIDTSWLLIGHADEVVSFVPAPNHRGFRVLVPSTSLARSILEDIARQGPSEQKVFADHRGETTVVELLEEVAMSRENESIMHILDETRIRLCEGLGIDSSNFIEIPALFQDGKAVIPNCVNGLICNGHAIFPDPLGPRMNDEDAFASAVQTPLTSIGVKVHFVDIWEPYHVDAGEVHCGTNTIRRLRQPAWWDIAR